MLPAATFNVSVDLTDAGDTLLSLVRRCQRVDTGSRFGVRPTVAATRAIVSFDARRADRMFQVRLRCSRSIGRENPIVLIAGGIGITPIIGISSALMRRNAELELHYARQVAARRRVSR